MDGKMYWWSPLHAIPNAVAEIWKGLAFQQLTINISFFAEFLFSTENRFSGLRDLVFSIFFARFLCVYCHGRFIILSPVEINSLRFFYLEKLDIFSF